MFQRNSSSFVHQTHSTDNFSLLRYAEETHGLTISTKKIQIKDAEQLIAKFKELGCLDIVDTRAVDQSISLYGHYYGLVVEWNEYEERIDASILYRPGVDISKAVEILGQHKSYVTKDTHISVDMFYVRQNQLQQTTIQVEKSKRRPIIDGLYPGVNMDELAKAFLNGDESLLVLYGVPGTGKTTLSKYLMLYAMEHNLAEGVAYANHVDVVHNSEFWTRMVAYENHLLVLDDISYDIIRKQENTESNKFVSNLLSFCDGIINEASKVIITTNQQIDKMDPALIRPGRCFGTVAINPLTLDEARDVWVNKLKMDISTYPKHIDFNKSPVQQAGLMREYKEAQKAKLKVTSSVLMRGTMPHQD